MSVILITSHNENIYDTSKIKSTTEKQPLIYKSKFSGMKKPSSIESKNYKQHATMGLPHMPLPNPTEFLKRNTWKPPINPCTQEEHDQCHSQNTRNNPLVPNRDEVLKEQDAKLKHTKKDYITKNVKAAVRTKPKEPVPKVVLDRYGSKKELKAGLEPRFIFSEVFGRTPRYLQNIIKLKEQQIQEDKDKLSFQQPKCRYITREERDNLLTGLKQNWAELQKQYQGLPILTDTIPKINRKSKIESDLKQLEKDIVLIERHPYIYVYKDDDIY